MKKIISGLIVLLVLIQFIPYGKDHVNPKVIAEPKWDTPQTRDIFMRACGDCHSNETKWPWYSKVAPVSWSVYHHVEEGREHFNISMWGQQKKNEGKDAAEEVEEGDMPLFSYLIAHPEARLSGEEKQQFIKGLENTFGRDEEKDED
ncbi:heme-binding domain-containing protein [Sulfurovum sp.]|uniref:heme-binding domain-containing protein n=1 Tax=Sulfurovum sp. TaxID=1969726 RepID=UPI0025FCD894|nr:heme-binding domain-containing protein [Sulfurovum sp.]